MFGGPVLLGAGFYIFTIGLPNQMELLKLFGYASVAPVLIGVCMYLKEKSGDGLSRE